MTKGIIYYTDNRVIDPIFTKVQEILTDIGKKRDMPISSTSLQPIEFGDRNKVMVGRQRSYPTYVLQITEVTT